ncbi:MAG TPA: TIGR04500 family putative peptide maturation system protein [Kofleriaceae bacterium]|nr:TIGR04500 family putative peptide maturation system protein [Kofleriaceae bacterium]
MSEDKNQVIIEVLDFLDAVNRESMRPQEARQKLRLLQSNWPGFGMELVWEAESYDESLHYDVLLRHGDGATVALSVCLDRALPWPLRGVRRWSDAELAQVNGQLLTMQHAVDLLDVVWNEAPIRDRLINACLVKEELERYPIEIEHDELQRAVDGLRRAHKLYSVEETLRWMQQRGLSHEDLELLAAHNLRFIKLRERVTAAYVEAFFENQRSDFDTADVARLECGDAATATHIYDQIMAGELGFFEAAQRQFVAGAQQQGTLFARLRRRDIPEALGKKIFSANPGDVIGPEDDGLVVTRVLSRTDARLETARGAVEELLFERWLAERRRSARITWHWGTTDRTHHAA